MQHAAFSLEALDDAKALTDKFCAFIAAEGLALKQKHGDLEVSYFITQRCLLFALGQLIAAHETKHRGRCDVNRLRSLRRDLQQLITAHRGHYLSQAQAEKN